MKRWFREMIRREKTDTPRKGWIELKAWVELLIIFVVVGGFIILVMSGPR